MAKRKKRFGEALRRFNARRRRDNVATRAVTQEGADAPPSSIFLINKPLVIGPTDSRVLAPILTPNREWKNFEGRYPSRAIVSQLRNALAVHAFTTFHSLRALLDDPRGARDRVEECAGRTMGWLRDIALEKLSELTLFRDAMDVERWARWKVEGAHERGEIARNRIDDAAVERELSSVSLLSFAYFRAQRIVAASEEMQKMMEKAQRGGINVADDEALQSEAHSQIESAYNSAGWDRPISDLLQIAMYSDINPVALWPQHNNLFATVFQLARFAGRINAGRDATLDTNGHGFVVDLLRGNLFYEFPSGQVAVNDLRHYLTQWFDADEFINKIALADAFGRSVSVTAVERQLILVDRVGPPPKLSARTRGFFSLFSRSWRDFFRMNPRYTH